MIADKQFVVTTTSLLPASSLAQAWAHLACIVRPPQPILVALVLLLIAPGLAGACSCVFSSACGTWRQGDVVFLGTVLSKDLGDARNPNVTISSVVSSAVRFSVVESFRGVGNAGSEVVVHTTEGCCACGYPFTVGSTYLVYASGTPDKLSTSTCTLTRPAVVAGALLRELRAQRNGQPTSFLFGLVGLYPTDARIEAREQVKPLSGVFVRAVGVSGARFTETTGADGVFQFKVLPPDTYGLEPSLPAGLSTWEEIAERPLSVVVDATGAGCEVGIAARPNGRISGQVLDSDGRPFPGFVTVLPADPAEERAARQRGGLPGQDTTDGHFKLSLLPPGQYRLVFRPKVGQHIDFRQTYYWPGVTRKQDAEIVEIGEGQPVDGLIFKVPKAKEPQ